MSKPIPQPPGLPWVGNISTVDQSDSVASMSALGSKYGEIFKLSFFGQDTYIVNSARLAADACDDTRFKKAVLGPLEECRYMVRSGLFTAYDGEEAWGVAHRILLPYFGPLGIQSTFDEMHDIVSQCIAKFARMGPDHVIDVVSDYTRVTLDSLALCYMNTRFNSFYSDKMHPFVEAMTGGLLEAQARPRKSKFEILLNRKGNRDHAKNRDFMRQVAGEVIEHRKQNPTDKKDLVNAMLYAKDPQTGKCMTEDSVIDNMITFLVAGHETTSGLLSYVTYHLLKNPSCLQKAQHEVDTVIGTGTVKVQHMSKLPYLDACLRESLRLSPTAPVFRREAISKTEPIVLGGDYLLSPNSSILLWLSSIGRDVEAYGPDAAEFNPERMLGDNFKKLKAGAWIPFGHGARSCIGRSFAIQESLLTLALLLQNFDLRMDDPSYQLKNKQTLTIKPTGFFMKAKLRQGVDTMSLEKRLHSGASGLVSPLKAQQPVVQNKGNERLTILFGGNAGTCEGLSQKLASAASANGYAACVKPLDDAIGHFPLDHPVVIVASSYEGQPPDNARGFMQWLKQADVSTCKGAKFAVFGCGHTDWTATYQKIPKVIESELVNRGAVSITPRGETNAADGTIFDDFDSWVECLWSALGSKSGELVAENLDMELSTNSRSEHLRQSVSEALVLSNTRLTPEGTIEKRHVEFKLPTGVQYEAGDYLAVLPINNVTTISRVLRRFGLPWDATMKLKKGAHTNIPTEVELSVTAVLGAYVELNTPATKKNIALLAKFADTKVSDLLNTTTVSNPNSKALAPSILDILESHPTLSLPFSTYLALLPPMRIRQYSISSSPLQDPTVASITFAVANSVDQKHLGVATNYLRTLEPGTTVHIAIKKSNPAFHLPLADETTPVIMIASGTGISPFRGFVQERAAKLASIPDRKLAPAVLVVGSRDPKEDSLHADEFAKWEQDGVVAIHHAYSRVSDQTKGCKYAQDRLWEEREEIADLFENGARIYVCGAARLGKGVGDTAQRIWLEKAEQRGKQKTAEDAKVWWESLRGERVGVDVFD